jgi:cyclic pyranopterin phosphate synthase
MTQHLLDNYHRHIDYLRISVTDRCDLRCIYCSGHRFERLSHDDILRYEEIERVVKAAVGLGVKNIRLTGGEPLVRPHLSSLVAILSSIPEIEDISMTTNATQLAKYARELKEAGLKRVNISLDTFKPERYAAMCGFDRLEQVLKGIEVAQEVGFSPVKINTVIMRGINEDEIADIARKSITDGWNVRFIEEMPLVGDENGHKMVSIKEIRSVIENELGGLEACWPVEGHGPAKYYRFPGSCGSVGFIAPVTDCFCELCNRFRLTADGKLRPCLLRDDEVDIREALRRGASLEELQQIFIKTAALKHDKHALSEQNGVMGRQMWQIGG